MLGESSLIQLLILLAGFVKRTSMNMYGLTKDVSVSNAVRYQAPRGQQQLRVRSM